MAGVVVGGLVGDLAGFFVVFGLVRFGFAFCGVMFLTEEEQMDDISALS